MRSFIVIFVVAAALLTGGVNAAAEEIYREGWDDGTSSGWTPYSPGSILDAQTSDGNPGGYLGIQGASGNNDFIGALTTLPAATGNYAETGVGIVSFDVRFVSGTHTHLWIRLRPQSASAPGWTYATQVSRAAGTDWRSVAIGLDVDWDDLQARNGGWFNERGAPSFKETTADVYSLEIVFLAAESVDARIDNISLGTQTPCPDDLPDPVLLFKGKSVAGDFLIKWEFAIENWQDYPAEMFLPAPELPPCGSKAGAPRTSHHFKRASGRSISYQCGVNNPAGLQDIFFTSDEAGSPDVYVELVDRRCDKVYVSNTVSTVFINDPPKAMAGEDQTVDCAGTTTPVVLDGSMSTDPDGDDMTFEWMAQGVTIDDPTAMTTVGHFPKGKHLAVLNVSDGLHLATDVAAIDIVDTSPPNLEIGLNRYILWPPCGKFFDVHATVKATESCGEVARTILMGIYDSYEPDDPNSSIRDADIGEMDADFQLLAKRYPQRKPCGRDREYAIVYMTMDNSLNLTTDTVYVRVPHHVEGRAKSATGFDRNGSRFVPGAGQFALVVPSLARRGSESGFDAAAIEAAEACVANSSGVLKPVAAYRGDVDGDDLDDMVLVYPVAEAEALVGGEKSRLDPLSLYYRDRSGGAYAVENVFNLGKPLQIVPGQLRPVKGVGNIGRYGDPFVQPMKTTPVPQTTLGEAFPNPFNPTTTISFTLAERVRANLSVYNIEGKLVNTLVDEWLDAGAKAVKWNGEDNEGEPVSSGVYFYRLTAGKHTLTKKMVLLK